MSVEAVRRTGVAARDQWATRSALVVSRWAPVVAARPDPGEAAALIARLLMAQRDRAQRLGAAHAVLMERAAGIASPAEADLTRLGLPPELRKSVRLDWERAREATTDTVRARTARAARIIDTHLTDAWRAGMVDAMDSEERVRGWRRVAEFGACGACLALMDGRVMATRDAFRAHPACRCYPEPAVDGVNIASWGRPTGEELFASMTVEQQDALFTGRGGAAKADLLRTGKVPFGRLVSGARGSMGGAQMVTETPLAALAA